MSSENTQEVMRRKGSLAQQVHGQTSSGAESTAIGSTQFISASSAYVRSSNTTFDSGAHSPAGYSVSRAGYAALLPYADALIQEAVPSGPQPHVFAAVITSDHGFHGSDYLRRHLHSAVTRHIASARGDVVSAFRAALQQLDLKFKALHIQKGSLLTGIHIAAVYIDFVTGLMSLMSNHGCRATIASSDDYNSPVVTHQLGRTEVTSSTQQSSKTSCNQSKSSRDLHAELDIVSVPISLDMDHIILGSSGLWAELTAQQASFRVSALCVQAPHALAGNSAAAVAQLALQAVARRAAAQSDLRISALRDTDSLQQLWTGSQRNFRWGGRQPLRRRRGDVHGDLSAIVIRFDWAGSDMLSRSALVAKKMCAFSEESAAQQAVLRSASGGSISSVASFNNLRLQGKASHWDLVRSHFLTFRSASRAAALSRWHTAVAAAMKSAAANKATGSHHHTPASAPASAVFDSPMQPDTSPVANAEAADRALARKALGGVSRRVLELSASAGAVHELKKSRSQRCLSRLAEVSKGTFSKDSLRRVLVH